LPFFARFLVDVSEVWEREKAQSSHGQNYLVPFSHELVCVSSNEIQADEILAEVFLLNEMELAQNDSQYSGSCR
jgi:hypothetical protein